MIIDQFNISGVAVLEPEHDAPVGSNGHGPVALPITLEGMKLEAGHRHVLYRDCLIQLIQDRSHAGQELGANSPRIVILVQPS